MASSGGGGGAKFVSVNLNKSYGQPSHHSHPPYSGSHGPAPASRARPGGQVSGGGGGMVVLSRQRSTQKAALPKLSVPPPLNLPSLRKEHERFDSSGSGGGSTGGAGAGNGSRPTSSGLGWTKPGAVASQEKGDTPAANGVEQSVHPTDSVSRGSSTYMPPSARIGGVGVTVAVSAVKPYQPERAMVLRGEDFPSLHAALPTTSSGSVQKQKDSSNQRQKQIVDEGLSNDRAENYPLGLPVHMRPHGQSSQPTSGSGLNDNGSGVHRLGGSLMPDQVRKQEDFPAPLPLVRLNPRSDWADDERDTGHGFVDRGRDSGFQKAEAYWDREFDMPRSTIFPHKLPNNQFERWGQRGHEIQNGSSSEILKVDPYRRDVRTLSREGRENNLWRNSPTQKDGFSVQIVHDRNGIGRPPGPYGETGKEIKYTPALRDNAQNGGVAATAFGRRDIGHGQVGRQHWNHTGESFGNRGTEWHTRDRYGADQSNRYRVDAFQNSTVSRSSFSSGGKGLPTNDPWLNFGREKRAFSKSEVPYVEDPFLKDFGSTGYDERDPFSGGLVGVIKKKKDAVKDADFHDPVRESFEAELERVQKLQEMERQRMVEEQERALEQARREEEERLRLIREEEEQRIRLEEEAREAAWRAEQDRLEALQRAEEQKIAREEERRRMDTEEERRKQAAKQKLLELEAKMAKRRAETVKGGNSVAVVEEKASGNPMEQVVSRALDLDNWEDSERMVERITTSASSDSSFVNRPFELSSGPHHSRDGSSGFLDRGKPVNPWRRDAFENGNSSFFQPQDQENVHHSPRRDASIGGRAFPRKEFYGGAGYMSSRTHVKGGMQEPNPDDFDHLKEHRWNLTGDRGHFKKNRELESDMYENFAEKYGDVGWGQGRSHGSPHSPYPEQLYPNSDADEFFSYGRSRYSLRQPRVLPPPSVASMHKASFRGENDCAGPSTSLENDISALQKEYYGGGQEKFESSELYDGQQDSNMNEEQKADKSTTPRCDSQSSLSVSSPPSSPTHLSHDELDESGDSLAIPVTAEGKGIPLSDHESVVLNERSGKDNTVTASSSISAAEDEDWTTENNEEMQEPEEYDEDEDGYQEEDEVHEGDDENIDLTHNFEEMHLEEKNSVHMMDNMVLGFDEGVEVGIPCDDFDGNSKIEENKFGMPEVSVGIVGEEGAVGGIRGDGQSLQPMDVQHVIFQPLNAPHTTAASDLLGSVDASSQSDQHALSSSVGMVSHSSSDQAITSSVSSLPSQLDLPIKLQFGLFSGPSLIPSPVPAIQIGSIQMPLHLHPPVGPSVTHMHPSQPPLFQFGQLRYTSPLSQGILPMTPQSVSFVQPGVQNHYSLNQNSGSSVPIQAGQDTSTHTLKKDNNQSDSLSRKLDVSRESGSSGPSSFSVRHSGEKNVLIHEGRTEISQSADIKTRSQPGFLAEHKGNQKNVVKDFVPSSDEKGSEGQLRVAPALSRSVSGEKGFNVSGAHGHLSGSKVKKVAYPFRNSGSRSSFPVSEAFRSDSIGYQRRPRRAVQRTEFRIRENGDRRQPSVWVSSSNSGPDDRSNSNGKDVGIITRSGFKRGTMSTKPPQQTIELGSLSSDPISSQEIGSESRAGKGITKGASTWSQGNSGQGNLKRNNTEDDVDAPLQSGIVRVFKQPGIEAPSDEDDFIEVRSKRQMLNDRREQREKEIKAKSRVTKPPRKARYAAQGTVVPTRSNKIYSSVGGEAVKNVRSDYVVSDGRGLVNKEVSSGFSTMSTQPLAPIGTPTTNADAQADIRSQTIKSLQTGSVPVVTGGGKDLGPNLIFENKNKVLDSVQTSLSSWGNARINQQVMALTQTQLDEAMKPARFDTHITSMGGRTTPISDTILPSSSSSVLAKDKSVSSSASPINSLLAGEKIQFGAVTSPTVLPPSSRVVSHGIGPPGSFRSDIQISHNLSPAENGCTIFFEKDKHPSESCVHLEDCEAEAEAAASAIAVAAISSDEIGGSGLGSVSVSDSKSFGGADVDVVTGVASDLQSGSQSRAEESLSVSLPADLSVETPPISLWPPLPSPQNSLSQMLSHFPGGPPSHFPFYEMNPMLGGPIFAFGPHEESGGTQSQSQKSTVTGPGHLGTWQQCHSTLDSFYGHPSGFTGPFISPPGGMPGVQGPPHMVVYNHYTPVGQFGQVGLSFMGATYIPSGKQPDWKHNPTSSAMGIGEGDMNMNMISGQRNPSNMPAPIQHLAPGSPLLPMASPLAMFDVSPFQSAPDMSAQARWSHIPASPLHSVPLSLPLQQQAEGILPSQFSHGHPVEQSLTANRFPESRTSTPSENGRTFTLVADASATRFPDELGLVDSSSSIVASVSAQGAVNQSSTGSAIENVGVTRTIHGVSSNNTSSQSSNAFKTQHSQQKNFSNQQYNHITGYGYQRGGVSQKNSSVGEWSHRRIGFHGRNQSLGSEKIFPPSKVRQIYVAKQTTGGTSTGG